MRFAFAPEATPLAGYTIKRAIDRGGFGEVYYALSDSGKEVALKLLQRNQQVELRGVSQCLNLKHPNLVTIFDIRTDEEADHWVVMEYVSGKSLEVVLDENPKGLPLAEVEEWLAGIAAGTAFLHDRGIVHRDLKPANVFRENGVVKIGDVGLSKFITPSRRSAQTESVGTVYYMAPEVARGKYGSELDVYSLGVILYEMLTGHVPFTGESTGEILMKHLTEPPDLEKIPVPFRAVLGRALEKDPQRRTPGAEALLEEFRRVRQGKPLAAEIPASHFVDVPQLERNASLKVDLGGNGQARNVNAATAHFPPAGGRASNPFPIPQPPAPPPPLEWRRNQPEPSAWTRFTDEVRRKPFLAVLVVVAVIVLSPRVGGSGSAVKELLSLAGVSYLVYLGITRFVGRPQTTAGGLRNGGPPFVPRPVASPPSVQPARAQAPPPVPAVPVATPRPAPRTPPRPMTPETHRLVSLRQRLSDLSGSMTMAAVWSALVAAAVWGLASRFPSAYAVAGRSEPLLHDIRDLLGTPAGLGLFAVVTLLGSWGILASSKFWEGSGADPRHRRLIQTALGAAVGACAYWVQQTLFLDPGYQNTFPGLVKHIGSFELLTRTHDSAALQPALAGYVLYFAALFGIRRWWWQADAFRSRRFRISSVLFSALVAFVIPAAIVFHQEWGVLWSLAISVVVQLSAPWVSPKERPVVVAVGEARQ